MADGAQDHAEARARLALAGAGVDDEDAAVDLRGGDALVDHGLLVLHLALVALGVGFGHEIPQVGTKWGPAGPASRVTGWRKACSMDRSSSTSPIGPQATAALPFSSRA